MRVTKYSATGYFCSVSKYKRHPEKPGRVVCSYVVSCYVCCYGCCASQEGRHVCAVPRAPCIFFQPLSLRPTYHGFRQQCTQSDTPRQLALWAGSAILHNTRKETRPFQFYPQNVNVWQDVCLIQYMILWGPMRPKTEVALTASPGLDLLSTDREVGKFCFCVFNMQNCTLLFPIHLASSLLTTRAWLPLCIIAILVQAPHLRLFSRQPS